MTDTDLEALFAEKVCSYRKRKATHGTCCTCQKCGWPNDIPCLCDFSPLTSLDDAFAGLRAHPEWPWDLCYEQTDDGSDYVITIWPEKQRADDSDGRVWAMHDNPNRAIVLACLRAVGCDV